MASENTLRSAIRRAGMGSRLKIGLALFLTALLIVVGSTIYLRHWSLRREIVIADPDAIASDSALAAFALGKGRTVFLARCAACHGATATGNAAIGVPDLTDRDFLYGEGRVSEIEDIVRHGIRSGDRRGRHFAYMPAYASAKPYDAEPIPPLPPADVRDVVQGLLARAGKPADAAAAQRGTAIYLGRGGCYDCHGGDARGDPAIGAPNLLDAVWLYGDGSAGSIARSIEDGHKGYSPAYANILSAADIRAVAVYVASLPGKGAAR